MGAIMNMEFSKRTNTLEYVADLALQFEEKAWFGKEYAGVGPTDGSIIAMGLRLLAAQLPGEAALARAE